MEAAIDNLHEPNELHVDNYGAHYYLRGAEAENKSRPEDLYSYRVFFGPKTFYIEEGDSAIIFNIFQNCNTPPEVVWTANPKVKHHSPVCAIILRGYSCGEKSAELVQNVNLPYVNGCATRQIFPPERVGDPTVQQLTIPPHTSEQVHHIHPTARVVYVLKGRGWSIVGQKEDSITTELVPGMLCVLDPMCPHHFKTEDEPITVIPIHVFSSTPPSLESNHPMFNGTVEV